MLNRRNFMISASALALLPLVPSSSSAGILDAGKRGKAPFTTLYNNDCTNILYCVSPWNNEHNNPNGVFSNELIDGSVAEVAGLVDVQMYCPGLCWVPWWKSKRYPAKEHYRWYNELMGLPVDGPYDAFGNYMAAGGDVLAAFLKACRLRKQTAFVSFRLNDVQFLQTGGKTWKPTYNMCKFWYDNPSYTLGTDWNQFAACAQNWAIPEVVHYKLELISEICLNYDIDGLELDFMRYFSYFPEGMDATKCRNIMYDFVVRVRAALDQGGALFNRQRYLSVRIPAFLEDMAPLGIDLHAFVDAGVDMFNLAQGYITSDDSDLPLIRKTIPKHAVYHEATYTPWLSPPLPDGSKPFLRTTYQQFHTAANVTYHQGGDGISLFNFAYYRQRVGNTSEDPGVVPFNEPPFDVLSHLKDRDYVASFPQWYMLVPTAIGNLPSQHVQLPYTLEPGAPHSFTLAMYPKTNSATAVLRLRIENSSSNPPPPPPISVWVNNNPLGTPVDYIANPLPDEFKANDYLNPNLFYCYQFSTSLLTPGENAIQVSLAGAAAVRFDYLDVSWT